MRQKIQKFGRSLSKMVMPNIGAFIAWGFITALFIPTGWFPNEKLAELVDPMLKYLLPLLIAYTGGRNVGGERGGVIGAIATAGVIAGSGIPMFIGSMIMGPLAGWCIKRFDKLIEGRVKAGFEMLVNNFSIGIIGLLLAIAGYLVIGNVITWLTLLISEGVDFIIQHGLLPLAAVFVEPAKVLFLNNAINHGVFSPIGIEQARELGQSIMFLIESNPGPGLGMLMAYWVFGQGSERQSAPGAIIIQFFGGIHEIYFPYILAKPALIISTIAGSAAGLLFFSLTGSGLVAPASPGSIIAVLAMGAKGQTLQILLGVLISAVVSFIVAMPFIKIRKRLPLEEMEGEMTEGENSIMEQSGTPAVGFEGRISKIVFACDAGMGSSALGATRFRMRLQKEFIELDVRNFAADSIPADTDVIVCQTIIAERIAGKTGRARLVVIKNFLEDPELDKLLAAIKRQEENEGQIPHQVRDDAKRMQDDAEEKAQVETEKVQEAEYKSLLMRKNIVVGIETESKEEAIRRAGALLAESGYVKADYIEAMIAREELSTTYMGMGIAIPHGTSEAKGEVISSGISVLQYPEGVDFGEEKAHLIIGIAGVGDEHLEILAKLSETLEDEEVLERLMSTDKAEEIYNALK